MFLREFNKLERKMKLRFEVFLGNLLELVVYRTSQKRLCGGWWVLALGVGCVGGFN